MDKEYVNKIHRDIIEIAIKASKIARENINKDLLNEVVGANITGDIIRRIDVILEDFIIKNIFEKGYKALIISEERGVVKTYEDSNIIFIIDPLDGSSNYVADTPYASISIAVADKEKNQIITGVVSEVFRDKVYSFIYGEAAYVNNEKISIKKRSLENIILSYVDDLDALKLLYEIWERLDKPKIRSLGSAALDIVKTALGHFRLFIDVRGRLRNIDIAAAYGFSKTLGAYVSDHLGRDLSFKLSDIDKIKTIIVSSDEEAYLKTLKILRELREK
ncbi:MAG: inositol monophosphatase [Desulfurococcaceae archaeon]|nr:inositol monophosphatase [Desulfurococcaceae archaeon]